VAVFVPVSGYLLYGETGSPDAPDQPLAARMASADPDINILIAKTEAHLSTHPDDGKGWELLAPIYMRAMRADDAANAWKNAIRLLGGDAERYGSLGEALSVAAKGEVTPDSLSAFGQSLKFDPKDPRSRFYVALADAQAGNFDRALEGFKALKADSPADAPWIGVVDNQIEQVSAMKAGGPKLGNPNAADIEAAAGMDAGDRMQMIRSMVESLDEKLKTEPDNFEGWMRLVRSYGVLKEPEKAADALKRGLAAFPPDSDNGKALLALADEMGIATGGAAK
jgi:cytochrome c-type biogenesis protein CcmH